MSYVFGPVRSRRLGRSLGIDPVPLKTCNWNCVYCQLGRTVPLTNVRRGYCPVADVMAEVRHALERSAGEIDWITFVGSGEPTLDSGIGQLIRGIKRLTDVPVAVITNGSLLHDAQVASDLAAADAVLPTLDAADEALYRAINRPHPALSFESLRQGLAEFRRQYRGLFWVEVMLVEGVNDNEQALLKLAAALDEIDPDEIHVNVPFRAPAEPWVRAPGAEVIKRACEVLGSRARRFLPAPADLELLPEVSPEALADVIARHPLPANELRATSAGSLDDSEGMIDQLADQQLVQKVQRHGDWFWCPAGGTYADGQAQQRAGHRRRRRVVQPSAKGRQGGKS